MKKTLLSAAAFAVVAVSAVSIAPTTSEAIPAFARQTGAACLSCHFQTFPAVNSFGRSFKMGAFTDVGEQALIEDDDLSIPSVLNSTFVLRAQYSSKSITNSPNEVAYNIPADAVLMIGGRVSETLGAFLEVDLQGGGAVNWQLMNSIDFGAFKGGLNIYNAGFGPTGAIEISNVFGQHGGKLNGKALSSVEQLFQPSANAAAGTAAVAAAAATTTSLAVDAAAAAAPTGSDSTTSVALWAGNEMGMIQLAAVATSLGANSAPDPRFAPLVRVVVTPELGGFQGLFGIGYMNGTVGTRIDNTDTVSTNASDLTGFFLDAQAQGDIGDMSVGVYADYTSVKGAGFGVNNNADGTEGTNDGYSVRIEVKPLHNVMFGLGYGKITQNNVFDTTVAGAQIDQDTTQTQVAVTYELYQNVEINAFYNSSRSGGVTTNEKFIEIEALM